MAPPDKSSPAAAALRQLVILERGVPVATKVIVVGDPLTAQNAPALLDELGRLEAAWQTKLNHEPRNDSTHMHLLAAFERLKIPFLSSWEAAEVEIRAALAAGVYDDPAWAERVGIWASDLWLVAMLGGDAGLATAKQLAAAGDDDWDRWLVAGKLGKAATKQLRDRFATAKGAVEHKPVKTEEKIDRQIGAFLAGKLDRAILDKSFKQWFAYCYHAGSPSNFNEKKAHVLAHNLFVAPQAPAATLQLVRASLPYFTPARAKARRVHLWDIEPIRDGLLAWKRAAQDATAR